MAAGMKADDRSETEAAAARDADLTPLQKQYYEIKNEYSECLLFFRLGDFYELFDEDARVASRELDLTLTTRDRYKPRRGADAHVRRALSQRGQLHLPAAANGLSRSPSASSRRTPPRPRAS